MKPKARHAWSFELALLDSKFSREYCACRHVYDNGGSAEVTGGASGCDWSKREPISLNDLLTVLNNFTKDEAIILQRKKVLGLNFLGRSVV